LAVPPGPGHLGEGPRHTARGRSAVAVFLYETVPFPNSPLALAGRVTRRGDVTARSPLVPAISGASRNELGEFLEGIQVPESLAGAAVEAGGGRRGGRRFMITQDAAGAASALPPVRFAAV
jgi:hypothetical protein